VVIGILWTVICAIYYLVIARGFGHGHDWRASQAQVQTPTGPTPPRP
jgi:hypothetical protein